VRAGEPARPEIGQPIPPTGPDRHAQRGGVPSKELVGGHVAPGIEERGGTAVTDQEGTNWEATRTAWDQVGNRFAELGRRLRDQYRTVGEERGAVAEEEARSTVKEAVQTAVQQMDQAFTSVGNAFRDPESKEDLQRAARSLADAFSATFADLSTEIRDQFGSNPPPDRKAPGE
jgi:hypothetical protein